MWLPLLSEYDPPVRAEGSIDPLGLYSIADALGVRLAPGVRERQSFPRFLTLSAVSLSLCESFSDEQVASDGVSEPWQVFEWYVVEGLVRRLKTEEQLRGLPGREKARITLDEGAHLSAGRYLKTPTVFGFHGVYRVLAREIGVDSVGRLGDVGFELLKIWEDEQNLPGFAGTEPGVGRNWKALFRDAIRDGLEKGAVARSAGWQGWNFIEEHLSPHMIGTGETEVLHRALLGTKKGFRGELLRALVSKDGQEILVESKSERAFHAFLVDNVSTDLKRLLEAISAYETFARVLQDAFDDCRYEMTLAGGKTKPEVLATKKGVRSAAKRVPEVFGDVQDKLDEFGLGLRFQEQFVSLADPSSTAEWGVRLMEHHSRVQRKKPPAGKAPWIEQFDDGSYMIRPQYRVDSGGQHDDEYVHAYRTIPLWSFAKDLGLVEV